MTDGFGLLFSFSFSNFNNSTDSSISLTSDVLRLKIPVFGFQAWFRSFPWTTKSTGQENLTLSGRKLYGHRVFFSFSYSFQGRGGHIDSIGMIRHDHQAIVSIKGSSPIIISLFGPGIGYRGRYRQGQQGYFSIEGSFLAAFWAFTRVFKDSESADGGGNIGGELGDFTTDSRIRHIKFAINQA